MSEKLRGAERASRVKSGAALGRYRQDRRHQSFLQLQRQPRVEQATSIVCNQLNNSSLHAVSCIALSAVSSSKPAVSECACKATSTLPCSILAQPKWMTPAASTLCSGRGTATGNLSKSRLRHQDFPRKARCLTDPSVITGVGVPQANSKRARMRTPLISQA